MQVYVDAGGVFRRGHVERVAALVRKNRGHVVLNGLSLRLGSGAWSAVGFGALAAAGAAAAVPFKLKITVQVSPTVRAGRAAVVFIGVLAPLRAALCLFASIRVGREHDVDFVVIQQPVHVRVGFVIFYQIASKTGSQLGRGIFPGVDGSGNEQFGLIPSDGLVGKAQDEHIITIRLPDAFLPGISDIDPLRQVGVRRSQRRPIVVELLHSAVAIIWRRQGLQTLMTCQLVELVIVGSLFFVQRGQETHTLDRADFGVRCRDQHILFGEVVELKQIVRIQLFDFFQGVVIYAVDLVVPGLIVGAGWIKRAW